MSVQRSDENAPVGRFAGVFQKLKTKFCDKSTVQMDKAAASQLNDADKINQRIDHVIALDKKLNKIY